MVDLYLKKHVKFVVKNIGRKQNIEKRYYNTTRNT